MVARLVLLVLGCSTLAAQSGAPRELTLIEKTEAVIDGQLPDLARQLAKSVQNLQLPTLEARSVFGERVAVVDVGVPDSEKRVDSVGVQARHWALAAPSDVERAGLALWQPVFEGTHYFLNASFKTVRGEFTDDEQRVLHTKAKFGALAKTAGGYRSIKAKLYLDWTLQDPAAEKQVWRITSWQTTDLETLDAASLLFEDVLPHRVDAATYAALTEVSSEMQVRAAAILANGAAEKTFDDLAVEMMDRLIPYSREEIEVVSAEATETERAWIRWRYANQVKARPRLAVLLGVALSEVRSIEGRMEQRLSEVRAQRRPAVAARVAAADARRALVHETVGQVGVSSAAVSITDFDRDGIDDVFVSRNDRNFLLRGRGDGSFEDVGREIGLPQDGIRVNHALFVDTDNDGDSDLVLGLQDGLRYYVQDGGRLVERTEQLGMYQPQGNVAISAADYDGDGLLDLYIQTRDIYRPAMELLAKRSLGMDNGMLYEAWLPEEQARRFYEIAQSERTHTTFDRPAPPNVLLKNQGGGRFARAEGCQHLEVYRSTHFAAWGDYDNDGDPDLYVANDFGPNNMFRNDGGILVDVTEETGTADVGFGMGVSWGDYDNDADQDLYVTNMYSKAGLRITTQAELVDTRAHLAAHGNTLFRNDGGSFQRVSGEQPPALTVEPGGWGWGSQFVDVDNDGYLDIYAPCGYISIPSGFDAIQDT